MSLFKRTIFTCVAISIICVCHSYLSAQDCDPWVARVVSVEGSAQVRRNNDNEWRDVSLNDIFCPGDMLRVQGNSRAAVILNNEAIARLDQNTTVTFTGFEEDGVSLIELIKGAAHFFSRVPRSLKVTTPFVNGAVEGTEFYISVDEEKTCISVFQGKVTASNDSGVLVLGDNMSAMTYAGKSPVPFVVASPKDTVKWALYYPPIQDFRTEYTEGDEDRVRQKAIEESIQCYLQGDLPCAFKSLETVSEETRTPPFYTYRAGLLLSVGRVDDAGQDIEQALTLDPLNGRALALKAIIAVAQNRKSEALSLAEKAVEQNPGSSAARIALSYAQQADFRIEDALRTLSSAVDLFPENALAHARLAELWMSVRELDKALAEARKAATLNPGLERAQTVLGFAYLSMIKTKEAKAAFERAILLDQGAPLPRLGLGLAKIREGDLKPGREEIEIAAGLAPNESIIRSYLGKAFFDEKEDKHAGRQLSIAKELDPNDPTPWFYDALRKQTLNRPVEALEDLQKSIELNDNRAVYRSRLLLDEDLAARSASLARIYSDLGFEQLALVEGWKSVNTDPSNYSAHRVLADSYLGIPGNETTRVSELLQSQLLQPIIINPVQPCLAESTSYIYEGAGPAESSFNEFNSLFLRDRLALEAGGVVGGNDTYGNELVHSAVIGPVSYSVGQFHYQTDGFRVNNDLDENMYNVFFQANLSYKTSIQFEYRYRETEKGDLFLKFNRDDFIPDLRQNTSTHTFRAGSRHSLTPNSDLLFSFIYRNTDDDWSILPLIESKNDGNGLIGEIQHIFGSEHIHLSTGLGHIRFKGEEKTIFPTQVPPVTFTERDVYNTNIYTYAMLTYPADIIWILGASLDFYRGPLSDRDQLNPKFGITWNPFPETTVRASVFRAFQRDLPSSQTLEPTQVAGFNQFVDSATGTEAWVYGAGIDQAFSQVFHGGLEFERRDREFSFESLSFLASTVETAEWTDDMGRFYLYWTPFQMLALSAEYQYERFERPVESPGFGSESYLKTHRFPFEIRLFLATGLTSRLKATYIDQDVEISEPVVPGFYYVTPDGDQSWVFDMALGYRLPYRWGMLSIEGKNLFDEKFEYQNTYPANPQFTLERLVLVKLTLTF